MILYLHDYLLETFSWVNILRYISFRAFLGAGLSFGLSLLWGNSFINFLTNLKAKQMIRQEGPESHHKKVGVPTMGGLLMIATLAVSSLIVMDWEGPFLWLLLTAGIGFGTIGFLDDYLKVVPQKYGWS